MDRYLHPRDEILATMERIYRYRLTTTSGGNISIREPDGSVWITPARVDKGALRRDDIVCVRPDGAVEGIHPPSSEFPFHRAIYAARRDLCGIVHAHPVALVAFSTSRRTLDTRLFHQARHVCGEVGFAPYALPGSEALGVSIAAAFQDGVRCVLMDHHGVVVGGYDLQHAFQQFETLEFTAQTIIRAETLGGVRYLTDEDVAVPHRCAPAVPSFEPGVPTSAEKELRRLLCDFVRRGYQQRLLISTEGSFSARLGPDEFLITPYQVDRQKLGLGDLVLVSEGRAEEGKRPSRAVLNHRAIYLRHPGIGALVNAYTVNATAFSVTGCELTSRTIPESYVFLREVGRLPFGLQFTNPEAVAAAIGPDRPILVLENDGVLVAGKSVLDAYDRLEVLESTAQALIDARPLGGVLPLAESSLRELEEKFLGPVG
ncbi:MAG: class II aldolase/adducin family protein [Phycisphaerales bacterium]|nr:class II aldolase/adducin family protein [Phycisphaerales bacterium]